MERINNIQLIGAAGRPFLLDLYFEADGRPKPIVIFAHGFKGFKDWGHWHLLAEQFAQAGFAFVKFNFSHNGTTLAKTDEFDDLEAFGQNNYSRELADLDAVMTWLHRGDNELPASESSLSDIHLIGHSRGGPIVMLQAVDDPRIRSVIGWASVSSLAYAWQSPEMIRDWEKNGVYYVVNGRTGQQMPIYYQMYRDYMAKKEVYNLEFALKRLEQPLLLLPVTEAPAVSHQAAMQMQAWKPDAEVKLIDGADHVFGGQHPYEANELPGHSEELFRHTAGFMKRLGLMR